MFTRFQNNVRQYPRTFTVLLVLAVIDAVLEIGFRRSPLVGDVVVAVLAVAIYFWFVRSANRVGSLLRVLDAIEGRTYVNEYGSDGTECEYEEESEEESDCGIPGCEECAILRDEQGQDVAEYAVMLAVILAIVIGVIHMVGSSANNVFSQIGSKIQ